MTGGAEIRPQALDYIGNKIKPTKFARRQQSTKAEEAREKVTSVASLLIRIIADVLVSVS